MSNYVSSIVNKYGDMANVKRDATTLRDILSRQGSDLLIDVLAEFTAETANKFKFCASDRSMTMISLVDALEEALKERL